MKHAVRAQVLTILSLGATGVGCSRSLPIDSSASPEHTRAVEVPAPEPAAPGTELERYRRDLAFISRARPPGSEHWAAVANRCQDAFEEAGLTVTRQAYATGVNVLGERQGTAAADELVIVSAHYDSVAECPGADDNASGVAGVLEVARRLGSRQTARTVLVACWDEEERGLIGSRAFVSTLGVRRVHAHFVFEMIGVTSNQPGTQRVPPGLEALFPRQVDQIRASQSRADFVSLVSDPAARNAVGVFEAEASRVGLRVVSLEVPEPLKNAPMLDVLRRSDHASFWSSDWPSAMLTDTAEFRNSRYHCRDGLDSAETVEPEFALRIVEATAATAMTLADSPVESPR